MNFSSQTHVTSIVVCNSATKVRGNEGVEDE